MSADEGKQVDTMNSAIATITDTQQYLFDTDTIAALSTPPGEGGIGIIRLSGAQSIDIALRLFYRVDGATLLTPQSHRQYYGEIRDPISGERVDEVLLCVMRAPRSYTCEDVVEISGHGGPIPLRKILSLVSHAGARLALPGEFTQRAFLRGRIDLTQAEAVLDTIRARSDAGLRAAQRHLRGEIGRQVCALRGRLIALLSTLEASIDFAEEGLLLPQPEELRAEMLDIRTQVAAMIASQSRGRVLREGAHTVIIGRPNTGKSSLLNALLGEARAIVTDIPGTTRDTIEEQMELAGIPLRLLDTAGIHPTDDPVEMMGVARSRESLATADLLLLVLDRAEPLTPDDEHLLSEITNRTGIILLNKADLPAAFSIQALHARVTAPILEISALRGTGLAELTTLMHDLLLGGEVTVESPTLANARQREAAERAATDIDHALLTLTNGGSEELLAVDLMAATSALGDITGDDPREEIIHEIFARFCIGK